MRTLAIACLVALGVAGPVSAQHLFNRGPFGEEPPGDEQARLGKAHSTVKKFEALRYFSIEYEEAHAGLFHRPGEELPREKTAELVAFSEKIKKHASDYEAVAKEFDALGAPRYAQLARRFAGIWTARLPVFDEEVAFQKAEKRIEDEMNGVGPEVEERRRRAEEGRQQEIKTRLVQGAFVLFICLLAAIGLFSRRRKKKKRKKKAASPPNPPTPPSSP